MFKLRHGVVLSLFLTGCVLFGLFITSLPDGKLHIVFCSVGQGDAAYIRFPDGRDMVVDGGPNDRVIDCLGRHMPFWDRTIDMVAMTHPQKDHMQGLISVFERFNVGYFLRSNVDNTTDGYKMLQMVVHEKHVPVKFMTAGNQVHIGTTQLSFIWPSGEQIAKAKIMGPLASQGQTLRSYDTVLGAATSLSNTSVSPPGDLNDYCLVFLLRYGSFDAAFTGDADIRVEDHYRGLPLFDPQVEVLKVPHHGSKTGFTDDFLMWLHPALAVISVGKNSYGHPTHEALERLSAQHIRVLRTDQSEDVEVVSDGKSWHVQ